MRIIKIIILSLIFIQNCSYTYAQKREIENYIDSIPTFENQYVTETVFITKDTISYKPLDLAYYTDTAIIKLFKSEEKVDKNDFIRISFIDGFHFDTVKLKIDNEIIFDGVVSNLLDTTSSREESTSFLYLKLKPNFKENSRLEIELLHNEIYRNTERYKKVKKCYAKIEKLPISKFKSLEIAITRGFNHNHNNIIQLYLHPELVIYYID